MEKVKKNDNRLARRFPNAFRFTDDLSEPGDGEAEFYRNISP